MKSIFLISFFQNQRNEKGKSWTKKKTKKEGEVGMGHSIADRHGNAVCKLVIWSEVQ